MKSSGVKGLKKEQRKYDKKKKKAVRKKKGMLSKSFGEKGY